MLTRALFVVAMIWGLASAAFAEETKVLALGVADHEVTLEELDKGTALRVPRFNSPGVAYALLANLEKGDVVDISLSNGAKALLANSETLAEDKALLLLQAGKRGVPVGGWPTEWKYSAKVKVTRDGETLLEQSSEPVPFE